MPSALAYRPDIDGLRAIAVLTVVIFHAGFSWLPGGYVGVDIFFVISGYLIGGILERQIMDRSFSVMAFYARRIGRIVPAFIGVVLGSSALAYRYLFPADLTNFAASLAAAALSVSNFFFWSRTGYFEASVFAQPLIHTWSLAIEEQFYIVLPLYLVVAARFMGVGLRRAGLGAMLLVSLGLSLALVQRDPEATFYLLHTRAWELLLGTVLAFAQSALPLPRFVREGLAVLGLALIGYAVLMFSAATPFPGAAALLPCLGAALLLWTGQSGSTVVRRALSLPPVTFAGLISYSLYLWHWPIIVFQRQYAFLLPNRGALLPGHPALPANLAIIGASVAAAILSWALIERPFRRAAHRAARRTVVVCGAAALVLTAALGGAVAAGGGLPGRFSPEAVQLADYVNYGQAHLRPGQCFILPPYRASQYDDAACMPEGGQGPTILLMGDSHAAHLWFGLSTVLGNATVQQATGAGCKPVLQQLPRSQRECRAVIDRAFAQLASGKPGTTVILSARWAMPDLPGLQATLQWLRQRGIRTIVLGPTLEFDSALPRLLALAIDRGEPELPRQRVLDQGALDEAVGRLAREEGASYASMLGLLCPRGVCTTMAGAVPLLFDDDHFTREGSVEAARRLLRAGILP